MGKKSVQLTSGSSTRVSCAQRETYWKRVCCALVANHNHQQQLLLLLSLIIQFWRPTDRQRERLSIKNQRQPSRRRERIFIFFFTFFSLSHSQNLPKATVVCVWCTCQSVNIYTQRYQYHERDHFLHKLRLNNALLFHHFCSIFSKWSWCKTWCYFQFNPVW